MSTDSEIVRGVLNDVPVVRRFGDISREIAAVRGSTALAESPHVVCVRVAGEDAYDFIDRVCAAPLYIRDGQLRHTLMLDTAGLPLADVYLGNDDGAYLLLAEGLTSDALEAHLRSHVVAGSDVVIENLSRTHSLLSLGGPFAWELLSVVEGPEVIGFPYLTFYRPRPDRIYFRAGKTGEYGYDLLVPHEQVSALKQSIVSNGAEFDLVEVGLDALWHCGFENWYYNIHLDPYRGLSPLELQLQCRLSPDKTYVGSDALRQRAANGIKNRIVGFTGQDAVTHGDQVLFNDITIGTILQSEISITTGFPIGVALIDLPYSHSGIDRYVVKHDNNFIPVRTVSPPFVHNLSLFVNPQRHAFADRHEIPYPGQLPRVAR